MRVRADDCRSERGRATDRENVAIHLSYKKNANELNIELQGVYKMYLKLQYSCKVHFRILHLKTKLLIRLFLH